MTSKISRPSEFELISKYFAPLAGEGSFGFADDAALIEHSNDSTLVITQDAIASGVHFFADDDPGCIAQKAVRVNLSDLAAKGATPLSISVALGLPTGWTEDWVADLAAGFASDCDAFDVKLSGGDTFATGAGAVISVTAIGEVANNSYVSRLGAKAGNLIFVTGTIGDGAFGLSVRSGKLPEIGKNASDYLLDRYLLPQPRLNAVRILREYATSSMDVSDGLIADAQKLAEASGVLINIQSAEVPLSPIVGELVAADSKSLKTALSGGDDYEILFTIKPEHRAIVESEGAKLPFPITCIGEVCDGSGVSVFDSSGHILEVEETGYDHSGQNQ